MNTAIRTTLAAAGLAFATQAAAQVTFFEHEGFQGRSFTTQKRVNTFERQGFNDRASSVVVLRDRWEVCQDARFQGKCVVLRPGRYPSLGAMGLNDRVSSVRPVGASTRVDDRRYAPPPPLPVYDSRRRNKERIYEADVTSARAVYGQARQRCWVEREQVSQGSGGGNTTGAILGGIIGGVLGHQVGSGTGQHLATAGGAVGGAALGYNVGRNDGRYNGATRDVQRCSSTPSTTPEYWDVTYNFRGQEHHMQTATPPGRTVSVNSKGEPRA